MFNEMKPLNIPYTLVVFLTFTSTLLMSVEVGPGIEQRIYNESELYETLSVLETTKYRGRGHAALQMLKGILRVSKPEIVEKGTE